jgi:hypothetical protein
VLPSPANAPATSDLEQLAELLLDLVVPLLHLDDHQSQLLEAVAFG